MISFLCERELVYNVLSGEINQNYLESSLDYLYSLDSSVPSNFALKIILHNVYGKGFPIFLQ